MRSFVPVALIGLVVVVLQSGPFGAAESRSNVGYLDRQAIVDDYAGAQIAMVINERDRLQVLFDVESEGLEEPEKQELFARYESQLLAYEESVGIRGLMEDIETALREAAEEHGVDVILDDSVVVYGGVDLTDAVRSKLGI